MKHTRNESVLRAFAIIEYLAQSDDWVALRTLARDLGLVPSTAYRFLASLRDLGYVHQQEEDSRYQLTLKFAWVASRVLERTQLRRVARSAMEHLTAISNETTHLAVLEGHEIVYIDKVDNDQAVKMRSRIGTRGHIHSTAVGKSILAFLPEEERERILEDLDLVRLTKNTIVDPAKFAANLARIRSRGFSVDDEENEVGIRCVGVPVFNHAGRVAGAVSISGWTITMTQERMPQLASILQEACQQISKELGFGSPDGNHGD